MGKWYTLGVNVQLPYDQDLIDAVDAGASAAGKMRSAWLRGYLRRTLVGSKPEGDPAIEALIEEQRRTQTLLLEVLSKLNTMATIGVVQQSDQTTSDDGETLNKDDPLVKRLCDLDFDAGLAVPDARSRVESLTHAGPSPLKPLREPVENEK